MPVVKIKTDEGMVVYKTKANCDLCYARGWIRVSNKKFIIDRQGEKKSKRGIFVKGIYKEVCDCVTVLEREEEIKQALAEEPSWIKKLWNDIKYRIKIVWWHLGHKKHYLFYPKKSASWVRCYWCNKVIVLKEIGKVTFADMCKCNPPYRWFNGYKSFDGCFCCDRFFIPKTFFMDNQWYHKNWAIEFDNGNVINFPQRNGAQYKICNNCWDEIDISCENLQKLLGVYNGKEKIYRKD